MKLFISYARVDKPFCLQIVNMLGIHEVWYDARMYAGQHWWQEILRRLDWSEAFIYLLSPESVASQYCRKEFEIARKLERYIIPVLINKDTVLPGELRDIQYVDLSNGLNLSGAMALLNSIALAERSGNAFRSPIAKGLKSKDIRPPEIDHSTVIAEAADALEEGHYDRAQFLLKRAREQGYNPRFIKIDRLLEDAERALQTQTITREMEREYREILELVKRKRTRRFGCEAFVAFQQQYSHYDPQNLARICNPTLNIRQVRPAVETNHARSQHGFSLPLLEWREIPEGLVTVTESRKNGQAHSYTLWVDTFQISKYPVTIQQYQYFVDDLDGYANPGWWEYSAEARAWREANPAPKPPRFEGDNHPRETVTWYEAVAYCNWLREKSHMNIVLPSGMMWQRAAQGDHNLRYPWGNDFDSSRCNTRESRVRKTTPVTRYPEGVSPYGVWDMAGNTWEWCLNSDYGFDDPNDLNLKAGRAVYGGSYVGDEERAQAAFHFYLTPAVLYSTIGFRLAYLPD